MPSGMERRGVVDRRHIQQLQSIITPEDMRKKRADGKEQQQADQPGFACGKSQSSKLSKGASSTPIADPAGHHPWCGVVAPVGLSPDTWAALQQTAKDLDVRGIFDPKINQLRSKMLQQVKAYKDMQAAQQHGQAAKAGYAAGAATQQGGPAAATQPDVNTIAGRLEALCAQVEGSLPAPIRMGPPHTAASAMSAASRTTYRTGGTCRTNQTRNAPTAGRQQQTLQQQPQHLQELQQVAGICLQVEAQQEFQLATPNSQLPQAVTFPGHALSSSALRQLERETVAMPIADRHEADVLRGDGNSRSCSCTTTPSTPATDAATDAAAAAAAAAAALAAGVLEWQQHASSAAEATATTRLGKEAAHSRGSASVRTSGSSGVGGHAAGAAAQRPTDRQSCQQLGVVMEAPAEQGNQQRKNRRCTLRHKPAKTIAACVAELAASVRPATPTGQAADSAAAAIQKLLTPAACEAFQASVAAAVDNHLKLYRGRLQQARQQLLERELVQDPAQQLQRVCLGSVNQDCMSGGSGETYRQPDRGSSSDAVVEVDATASGVPGTAGGMTAAAAADAALLTMQQLVALLAKRDAAPEQLPVSLLDTKQSDGSASAAAAPLTAQQAASHKLTTAQTTSDIVAAANEHLLAAAAQMNDSRMSCNNGRVRLSLGKIARVRQLGKTWHKLTARSDGNNSNSSSAANTGRIGIQSVLESSSEPSQAKIGKDSSGGSSAGSMLPLPRHVVADSAGSVQAWETTAAPVSSITAVQQQLQYASRATAAAEPTITAGSTHREPAGMRMPAPKLQAPTEQELAAVPLPSLPALLDLSHEPAKVLQARLQRVWAVLRTPPDQQMGMVLSYTTRTAVCSFEEALSAWETVAATVLQREGILRQLMQLRTAMQEIRKQQGNAQQRQQLCTQMDVKNQQTQPHADLHLSAASGRNTKQLEQPPHLLLGLDARQIQQLLWAFLAATEQVEIGAQALRNITGQQLTVGSAPYPGPGAVVSANQLQPILDEAWDVLNAGLIYS